MKKKIPILLLTHDRPNMLEKVLHRLMKYTDWNQFDLWILDNYGSNSNKKIINMYKYMFPFINVYSSSYNQLSLIMNEVIEKLKADVYIKLDDDILVSENWTKGFVGVFERNYKNMMFGSSIIPINGFGWVPFLDIMDLTDEFKKTFPGTPLNQDCMDVAVFRDKAVNEWIWNRCLDIDKTAATFLNNQHGNFNDLTCPHRYSIGAIVFSHSRWEEMGGWKVQDDFHKNLRKQRTYHKIAERIRKIRKYKDDQRFGKIADILALITNSQVGMDELVAYNFSKEKGYTIPVTTESIVFHFSFGPVDQYLMNTVYTKIKF